MTPVVSFVGHHNAGKTTFVTQVVKILKEKGYKVGVLKSTKHRGVIKDKFGKDSFRYRELGIPSVGVVTPEELVLFKELREVELLHLAFLFFSDCDILICEGFKSSNVPKFEVFRKDLPEPPLYPKLSNVIGVVSDTEFNDVRSFPLNEPKMVAEFIEEEFLREKEDVELFVDGRKIPLKPFVRSALKGVVFGFIRSLKGVEEGSAKVEIRISEV